ncbi:hypothetical protein ACWG0P_02500 [Amedibacillus sp. YH-ame6]
MKENDIRALVLKQHMNFAQHGTIWATIIPDVGAYHHGFGNMMYTMKDHILHINQEGIAIFAVDDMKGVAKEDTLIFIPRGEIKTSNIQAKLTKFIFTMETDKGRIRYKIRKSILGCPWHKENLSFLLLGTGG